MAAFMTTIFYWFFAILWLQNAILGLKFRIQTSLYGRCDGLFVSDDATHHTYNGLPLYDKRFENVLSFHDPESLAAVVEKGFLKAYHINEFGIKAYDKHYNRTFGFYQGFAAVMNNDEYFHIKPDGIPAYDKRWDWCGNFVRVPQGSPSDIRCPVKLSTKYYHIDGKGNIKTGPYDYCGDFTSHGQAVAWQNGNPQIIDANGNLIHPEMKSYIFDAQPPHKGITAVKDEKGWFFINRSGSEILKGNVRYKEIEPFYNGLSKVRHLNGSCAVISESGAVVTTLQQSNEEMDSLLEELSKNYWETLSLKLALDCDVLIDTTNDTDTNLIGSTEDKFTGNQKFESILLEVLKDIGLVQKKQNGKNVMTSHYELSPLGHRFIVSDRVRYWLQDRYIKAWLPNLQLRHDLSHQPDVFKEISGDQFALSLSQRVLASYAKQDWNNITMHLPIIEGNTVCDLGGGAGSLLEEIANSFNPKRTLQLICVDRPEVIQLAKQANRTEASNMLFIAGDLFFGSLPIADLYLLSRVMHDWDDRRVLLILKHVHQNSMDSAKVCIIDRYASTENAHAKLSLHMYLLQSSFERTKDQWRDIFTRSQWNLVEERDFNSHVIFSLVKRP